MSMVKKPKRPIGYLSAIRKLDEILARVEAHKPFFMQRLKGKTVSSMLIAIAIEYKAPYIHTDSDNKKLGAILNAVKEAHNATT